MPEVGRERQRRQQPAQHHPPPADAPPEDNQQERRGRGQAQRRRVQLHGQPQTEEMQHHERPPPIHKGQRRADAPADGEEGQQVLGPDFTREDDGPRPGGQQQRRGQRRAHAPGAPRQPVDAGHGQRAQQAGEERRREGVTPEQQRQGVEPDAQRRVGEADRAGDAVGRHVAGGSLQRQRQQPPLVGLELGQIGPGQTNDGGQGDDQHNGRHLRPRRATRSNVSRHRPPAAGPPGSGRSRARRGGWWRQVPAATGRARRKCSPAASRRSSRVRR